MIKHETLFSRRQMLKIGLGVGGVAVLGGRGFAQTVERIATPEVGMGPFYPILKPLDKDADLTSVKKALPRARWSTLPGGYLIRKASP